MEEWESGDNQRGPLRDYQRDPFPTKNQEFCISGGVVSIRVQASYKGCLKDFGCLRAL